MRFTGRGLRERGGVEGQWRWGVEVNAVAEYGIGERIFLSSAFCS